MTFSYKQDNNELVDTSEYTKLFTHIIDIPRKILFLEKHFLPSYFKDMYNKGIYVVGREKPIMHKHLNYVDSDDKEVIINNLDDLDVLFEHSNVLYSKDTYHKVFTRKEFINNRTMFSEYCTYPIFTKEFIKMVISKYMRELNSEKDLIDNDPFGMSDHIHLLDNMYKDMDILEFFENYGINDNVYFKDLLENYELLYMDILNICKKFNPLSVDIFINNNLIKFMFYDSPSSRRYNINKIVTSTDDISVYKDF